MDVIELRDVVDKKKGIEEIDGGSNDALNHKIWRMKIYFILNVHV